METQTEEHFFQVNLNQEGSQHLLKMYRLVKWYLAMTIAISIIIVVSLFIRRLVTVNYDFGAHTVLKIEYLLYPFYYVTVIVLVTLQSIFYFRFCRRCKVAIESGQTELFNQSFRWLVRQLVIGVVILTIEIAYASFSLYVAVYILNNIPRA